MKYFSNNFFSASVLSLMDANYIKKRKKFSRDFIDYIIKWTTELFTCDCKEKPYCNCGRVNLENLISSAKDSGIDAIIVHDIAAIRIAKRFGMKFHISTQANISNIEAAKFYEEL